MNFDNIKHLMDEALHEHEVPCSDIMIVYKGQVVYRYMNGTVDDERYMMRANQLGEQAYQDFQLYKKGYTYGLGVRTDAFVRYAHKGEFGWDGVAGSYDMIDPDNHIGIFYATHVCGHGEYLYKELHQQIRDEAYRVILDV